MKSKHLLLMLLMAFFAPWAANAQETVEIGTDGGTTTNNYLPAYTMYNNTLSEQIYTAEEVTMAGTISSISFYNGGSTKSPEIKLYLVNTDKSEFTSTTDWLTVTADNLVFDGTVTFTAGEWTTIEFTNEFEYDGTSNLGLVVDEHMQWSSGLACRVFTSTDNCSLYHYDDNVNFDATNPASGNYSNRLGVKNQIKLEITPSTGVVCDKPETFEASNVTSNSADLTWTGGSGVYNIELNGTIIEESYEGYAYDLTDLSPATNYTVRLQSVCGDATSGWKTVSFTTECDVITTLPWSENFDGYTGVTGATAPSTYPNDVMPNCWQFLNRSETTSTYPQVFLTSNTTYAVSGNCLFFKSSSTTPLYAILPGFAQDIANLQLTFTYRNEGTGTSNGTLIVGYMTDPTDASTFETVLTCDRTTTKTEMEVTFAGAPAGSYIAFMYQGGSSNNYYLGIDNVVVESAPTCLKPTDLAQTHTNHSATLSWTAGNEGQNAWQIAYSTTSFDPNAADFDLTTVEVIDNVDETSYTFDKTLNANTHYYMYVRGYCGDEDYSKWVGIDFTTGQANPSPTITTVDEITPVSAVLRWTAPVGDFLESYDIYYSLTNGQPTEESEIQYTGIDADYTSYILQNLTEGYWYVYMRAYHGETDGYSSWTPIFGHGFQVPEACPEPTGLAASDPTPNSITLTWTEGAEWQYAWKVAYSTDPEFNPEEMDPETFVEVFGQQGPTITCTVTGLESNTTYYFKVLGNCNNPYGDSDWTNAVSATTLVACPVPTDLVATPASTSATLSWNGYSDSYTVQYRTAGGYDVEQDFENGMGSWTFISMNAANDMGATGSYPAGITTDAAHSGLNSFRLSSYASKQGADETYDQYLISPELTTAGNLNFFARRYGTSDHLYIGISTTTNDVDAFTWEEVSFESNNTWYEFTQELNADVKYIAFHYFGNYAYYVYIDDITIGEYNEAGEWITYNDNVTSTTATIEGLEFGTKYDAQVKANCGEEYCDYITFTTNALKRFTTEGDWSVADNWTPAGVPTIEDNVSIEAAATITDIATANEININGGSITIEEGGQLYHNNAVDVTLNMSIGGWTPTADPNQNKDGYALIASPVYQYGSSPYLYRSVEGTGLNTGNYDLYEFNQNYQGAEWRNYKDNEFESLYVGEGYLYANQEGNDNITFEGTALPTTAVTRNLVYTNGMDFAGWNLVGNPFTCMADVNRDFYTLNGAGNEVVNATSRTIEVMEGIFVVAEGTNETVTFTPCSLESVGEIEGEPIDPDPDFNKNVVMNLTQGSNLVDRAIVRFGESSQLRKFQLNPNHTKVYIPKDGVDYAIVTADEMGEMPVSFKAENNGNFTLNFTSENVSFNYLHLIDNMTGADVDLLATPSYSFSAQSTDYANRFKLVFATGNNCNEDNFAFFSNGSFVINNDGEATLQVVDVMGRILKSETINGSASVNVNAAPGVYMLRLVNGDNMKVQKIVVR